MGCAKTQEIYNPPMSGIITLEEYDGRPRRGRYKNCLLCGDTFFVPLHRFKEQKYCSRKCSTQARSEQSTETRNCGYCNRELKVKKSRLKKSRSGIVFCNRDCKNKAQRIGGIEAIQPDHYGSAATITMTKGELYDKYGRYRARTKISANARDIYFRENPSQKSCEICNYDIYNEVCHIKGVGAFPRNTPISEINRIENLTYLCPNHHKEYDLGIININGR